MSQPVVEVCTLDDPRQASRPSGSLDDVLDVRLVVVGAGVRVAGQELDGRDLRRAHPGRAQLLDADRRAFEHLMQPGDDSRLARYRSGNAAYVIEQRRPVAVQRPVVNTFGELLRSARRHDRHVADDVNTKRTLRGRERSRITPIR